MLHVRETFVNETIHAQFGDSGWYESAFREPGALFRHLRSEYGSATKMFRDRVIGPPIQVGWVFKGTDRYEGTKEKYKREVWVEVSSTEPKRVLTNVTSPWAVQGTS